MTRYVILGAGAIGGSIGGLLADGGHDVLLVARGAHADAMRRDGLRLATPDRVMQLPIPVEEVEELSLRTGDVLVIATKIQDADALLTRVAGIPVGSSTAGAELPVVCAQNGVEGERIALRRFPRVYGMCVIMPAVHLEPGRIDAQGTPYPGLLDVGRYPRGVDDTVEELAEALRTSGYLSLAREEIMPWKYAKLLLNLGNAGEALFSHDEDERPSRSAEEAGAELRHRAQAEGRAVLAAAGITVTGVPEWTAYRGSQVGVGAVEGRPRGGGSSWQSASRGTGSIEADHLNGEVTLLGRLHGVPTPVNTLLQQEANALVRRGDPPGSVDPESVLVRLPVS